MRITAISSSSPASTRRSPSTTTRPPRSLLPELEREVDSVFSLVRLLRDGIHQLVHQEHSPSSRRLLSSQLPRQVRRLGRTGGAAPRVGNTHAQLIVRALHTNLYVAIRPKGVAVLDRVQG